MDAIVFGQIKKLEQKVIELANAIDSSSRIIQINAETELLEPDGEVLLSLDIEKGVNRFIIKTVYIEGSDNSSIGVDISTKAANGFIIYKNAITTNLLYDVIDLPFIDEDKTEKMHLKVKNTGSESSNFYIRISGLSTQQ